MITFIFGKTWKRFHIKAANYVQTNFHKLQNRRNATWKEKGTKRQQLFRLSPVKRIEHGRLFATTKHFFWCVCQQSSFLSCLTGRMDCIHELQFSGWYFWKPFCRIIKLWIFDFFRWIVDFNEKYNFIQSGFYSSWKCFSDRNCSYAEWNQK